MLFRFVLMFVALCVCVLPVGYCDVWFVACCISLFCVVLWCCAVRRVVCDRVALWFVCVCVCFVLCYVVLVYVVLWSGVMCRGVV